MGPFSNPLLKTHAGAVFRTRELPKPQGAGLYFEIAPGWVWIGGGMWRPEPPELVRIREHIADTWPELRTMTRSTSFRKRFEELSGVATYSREFYPTLVATFKALLPLVRFLNEPLLASRLPRPGWQMGDEVPPNQLVDMGRRALAFRD